MKRLSCCLFSLVFLLSFFLSNLSTKAIASEQRHKAANSLSVVNYARNLLLSIVDSSFRGSWVIDPENQEKATKSTQKIQKSFDSLANIKVGITARDVRKILKNPTEIRNSGKIWIYGIPRGGGTYDELTEVFFDDKEHVISVISFNSKNIVENTGVNIGDTIDKMIAVYGEPVDEKDFIEDPDNKEYLGLYYLYPRSGIGFLIGQDKASKNLLVQGVFVFGKS